MNNIAFRIGIESDLHFILSSWLKSYNSSPDNCIKNNHRYYFYQKSLIASILTRAKTVVICNKDIPEQIYGYCVYEETDNLFVLHWLYVKYTYRKLGLARSLLSNILGGKELVVTHLGKDADLLKKKCEFSFNFDYAFKAQS